MDLLNVALSTAVVSVLLGVCGYFINIWITSVNDSIKSFDSKAEELKKSVTSLETNVSIVRISQEKQQQKVEELINKTQAKLEYNMETLHTLKKEVNMHQQTIERYGEVFVSLRKFLSKKSPGPK